MKTAFKKKKIYLITVLSLFCLLFLVAGIYLLAGNKSLFTKYNIDKYPDVNNWCTNSKQADTLSISCNGLLLSIQNTGDNDSCFDTQIITNNKELKNLTICENSSSLEYTNDILGYKVLMPINIKFNYAKKFMNSYTFQSVSFDKMDESYIQSIVNEDIANLVTIDPNSTTIRNSVDFCPRVEKLPSYISEENKLNYTQFVENNINAMNKVNYFMPIVSSDTYELPQDLKLWICDSSSIRKIGNVCDSNTLKDGNSIPNIITKLHVNDDHISWGNDLDEANELQLNTASILYDGLYQRNSVIIESLSTFNSFIVNVSVLKAPNEKVLCSTHKVLVAISSVRPSANDSIKYLENVILNNLKNITSSTCVSALNEYSIDNTGLYLKIYVNNLKDNNFKVFEQCNNLSIFLK